MLRTWSWVLLLAPGILGAPALAPAQELPAEFQLIPKDAAIFVHADFQTLWKSPMGATFRKVKAEDITAAVKIMTTHSGITLEDIQTLTLFVPQAKDDGPPPVAIIAKTSKPYDRDKVLAYFNRQVNDNKGEKVEELSGNRYKLGPVTLDLAETNSFKFYFQFEPKPGQDPLQGPIAPAIRSALAGNVFTLGAAFENLPDSIRRDDPPAEALPFRPLFLTDTAVLTAQMKGEELSFDLFFKSDSRAKALEAEKSLGAAKTLIDTSLNFALQQMKKENDPESLPLVDFVSDVHKVVKSAQITHEENTPHLKFQANADMNYASFLDYVFGRARGTAARMTEQNNLKQIGLAMHIHNDAFGSLPPAALVDKKGKPMLSWRVMILPYIDEEALYKKFKLDEPWDSEHNMKVMKENPMPRVFMTPGKAAKAEDKTTHYQAFVGKGAMFDIVKGVRFQQISDGLSNTIMIATAKNAVPWTKPEDITYDPTKDPTELLLFVNDSCSIGIADGSVRSIKKTIDKVTLHGLITRAGGEVINYD